MFPLQRQIPPLPPTRRQTPSRSKRRRLRHHRQHRRSQAQRQQLAVLRHKSRRNPSEQSPGCDLLAEDSGQLCFAWVADDGVGITVSRREDRGGEEGDEIEPLC